MEMQPKSQPPSPMSGEKPRQGPAAEHFCNLNLAIFQSKLNVKAYNLTHLSKNSYLKTIFTRLMFSCLQPRLKWGDRAFQVEFNPKQARELILSPSLMESLGHLYTGLWSRPSRLR